MSGFSGAVTIAPGIVVIPRTCDGQGAWECGNPLASHQLACDECTEVIDRLANFQNGAEA